MQHDHSTSAPSAQRRWALPLLVLVLAMVATIAVLRYFAGGVAPVPGVFTPMMSEQSAPATLQAAMTQAAASGKPVLVFATADWCQPCQHMKRTTLADENVASLINERTIPYYLDVEASPAEARQLGVQGIPAFYIIDPLGNASLRASPRIIDSTVGASNAAVFTAWLNAAVPAKTSAQEVNQGG